MIVILYSKERVTVYICSLLSHPSIIFKILKSYWHRAARLPSIDGNSVKWKFFFRQSLSAKLPYIALSIIGYSAFRDRQRKNYFINMRKSQVRAVWKPIGNESFSFLILKITTRWQCMQCSLYHRRVDFEQRPVRDVRLPRHRRIMR